MVKQLDAIYEGGVLRPLEPLALADQQRVHLILDDGNALRDSGPASRQIDRSEELKWLAREAGSYAGEWVALSGSRLISHGADPAVVHTAARAAGVERPLLVHLPEKPEMPFGGW